MSNDDPLADAIQEYIDENNISKREAARRADINLETISRILNGNANPQRDTLRRLNENLDIDPETLI